MTWVKRDTPEGSVPKMWWAKVHRKGLLQRRPEGWTWRDPSGEIRVTVCANTESVKTATEKASAIIDARR